MDYLLKLKAGDVLTVLFDWLMSMKPKYFNFTRLIHEIIINFVFAK